MIELANRRRDTRYSVSSYGVQVFDPYSGQHIGTVANLSISGLMMIGDKKTYLGTDSVLELRWQQDGSEMHADLVATILWQTPAEDGRTYWSGHHITDITPDDLAALIGVAQAGPVVV